MSNSRSLAVTLSHCSNAVTKLKTTMLLHASSRVHFDIQRHDALEQPSKPCGIKRREVGSADKLFAKALLAATTRNFILVLLDNGRLADVEAIVAFQHLLDSRSKKVRAEVCSAVALEKTELESIKKEAERLTGQEVIVDVRVDESLIGGVVTRIGNVVLDGSVRTDLEVLREKLLA